MEEYKSNSHRSKGDTTEETTEKRVEKPVVTGGAKSRKKSEVRKLADIFVPGDVADVKSYIWMDVVVPGIKKAIFDIVTNGIDMILYGETGHASKKKSNGSKVSYAGYYDRDKKDRRDYSSGRSRSDFDYDDIEFETRGDAEAVLTEMDNVIEQYGFVTVGDFYDLADVSTSNYSVHKYGWDNLRDARVDRSRGSYVIRLPKPIAYK